MTTFGEAVSSAQQQQGEWWQQADELMRGCKHLIRVPSADGGKPYLVTPEVRPLEYSHHFRESELPSDAEEILGNRFALAALTSRRKYKPSDPLYLITNNNIANPVLHFEKDATDLMAGFEPVEDTNAYLPFIITALDKELEGMDQRKKWARIDRLKTVTGIVGAVIGVGLVAGGIHTADSYFEARELRNDERRARFDESDYVLPGQAIDSYDAGFVQSISADEMDRIPVYEDDEHPPEEDLKDARIVAVKPSDNTQEPLAIIDDTESVVAATDSHSEDWLIVVNSDGEVRINPVTTTEDTVAKGRVALQIVENPTGGTQ